MDTLPFFISHKNQKHYVKTPSIKVSPPTLEHVSVVH